MFQALFRDVVFVDELGITQSAPWETDDSDFVAYF